MTERMRKFKTGVEIVFKQIFQPSSAFKSTMQTVTIVYNCHRWQILLPGAWKCVWAS